MHTEPFAIEEVRATPLGLVVSLALPPGRVEVPPELLTRLHPREAELARQLEGRRRIEWVGGRLAYREALRRLGMDDALPLLSGGHREPLGDPALCISLSHKERLVSVLVAQAAHGTVGIDLEELGRPRPDIARMVLRPEEREALDALDEAARWPRLLAAFSLKEAAYKALFPHVQRFVGFQEACVTFGAEGPQLALVGELADRFVFELRSEPLGADRLLSLARIPR